MIWHRLAALASASQEPCQPSARWFRHFGAMKSAVGIPRIDYFGLGDGVVAAGSETRLGGVLRPALVICCAPSGDCSLRSRW